MMLLLRIVFHLSKTPTTLINDVNKWRAVDTQIFWMLTSLYLLFYAWKKGFKSLISNKKILVIKCIIACLMFLLVFVTNISNGVIWSLIITTDAASRCRLLPRWSRWINYSSDSITGCCTASTLNKRSKRGRQRGPTRHCYHSNIESQSLDQHRAKGEERGRARDGGRTRQRERAKRREEREQRWWKEAEMRGNISSRYRDCWQTDQCANALSIDVCVCDHCDTDAPGHTHMCTHRYMNGNNISNWGGDEPSTSVLMGAAHAAQHTLFSRHNASKPVNIWWYNMAPWSK